MNIDFFWIGIIIIIGSNIYLYIVAKLRFLATAVLDVWDAVKVITKQVTNYIAVK